MVFFMEANKTTTQLLEALEASGRSIAWAARELDVTYPHLHSVLKGRRNLSYKMRYKFRDLISKIRTPIAV